MRNLKTIKAGLDRRIRKAKSLPPKKYDQFTDVQTHFFERNDPLVILDVGAHQGESIERFQTVFPNSIIHSFEADEQNHKILCDNYAVKGKIFTNHFGLGSAAGKKTFYRNLKSDTSSFHPLNTKSEWVKVRSRQYNVGQEEFTQKEYEIEIRTLDKYMEENKIDHVHILKIDTQGYEDEVLKGAAKALEQNKIDMIETELIVGDVYQKSLSFYDIESLLLPYGYKFYAIDTGGDLLKQPSLSLNLIYVSEGLLS